MQPQEIKMSNSHTINPAWKAWNDVQNEGGEGYNPHEKWIAKTAAPVAAKTPAHLDRMLRQADGRPVPESKVRARLEKALATLPTLTNASAIAIFERDIAADQALLAA
ncbi:hypothetical protein ASF44_14700 [Pseudorhodoferax sp. Leaf274]|nr:hypothetical protein ASF44_14700 [Pseudorhodoferax sp. Leaf274]